MARHNPDLTQPTGDGRRRIAVERVQPEVDCGRFPAKRVQGEELQVTADIFADGHDLIAAVLLHRRAGESAWREVRMAPEHDDRWRAAFIPDELGGYEYTVTAWIDRFGSWRRDFAKRRAAGQDLDVDFQAGLRLIDAALARAPGPDTSRLKAVRAALASAEPSERFTLILEHDVAELMFRCEERSFLVAYPRILPVQIDPPRARFSTWYELFPRSAAATPGHHGTFRDVEARLDDIAEMGFDVLYLPPIHPIGRAYRKGKDNAATAGPDDVGSPWAIGGPEGGHKAIHPQLGTFKDFEDLVAAAKSRGIDIALDIAFQCSPDHPYIKEHPEWFRKRPDGSIQYAENPPKKYQDIYPFDFETPAWESLWRELTGIFLFWADRGVRIFRVDNPHTKAFPFWEWSIARVKERYPDAIFLAEAFTRPRVMDRLAKLGFTQSYTYFAWKNTKWELEQYFSHLTQTPVREYFRPNAWPNTPDILNEFLQTGERPAFIIRHVLAATLCASYGIYGPPFELLEHRPVEPGSEEYLGSEKYQLRHWNLDRPESLRPFISRVNRIRRENPALQQDRTLRFHRITSHDLICYSKCAGDNIIICIVNLSPRRVQWGEVDLPLNELGIDEHRPYQLHDLLTDARYTWHGRRNTVGLDPGVVPAHIFRLRRRARTERDFEYFL